HTNQVCDPDLVLGRKTLRRVRGLAFGVKRNPDGRTVYLFNLVGLPRYDARDVRRQAARSRKRLASGIRSRESGVVCQLRIPDSQLPIPWQAHLIEPLLGAIAQAHP